MDDKSKIIDNDLILTLDHHKQIEVKFYRFQFDEHKRP